MMKNDLIAIISLGCDKNRVDTETILSRLVSSGYKITDDYSVADVIIINTCSFIASAEKEAVDTIFQANRYRENGRLKKLIVTGCLPQRHKEALIGLLPEVDCFVGINDYDRICELIVSAERLSISPHKRTDTTKRILSTPPHYAYLKIAEGCDNFCTYCTIPSLRGPYRSGDMDKLTEEAKFLSDMGVRELIIVAQDTTRYGIDLYGEYRLISLIKSILGNTDIPLLRLMYCYPELVTDELIEFIASEPRIAKYIDIPLQHVSDNVLKRMGRKSSGKNIRILFDKLRKNNIKVRTTFMVGFPGEMDADFNELCAFVEEYKPHHTGVFAYSKERGTPSAKIKEQVPVGIKKQRVETLGKLHKKNAEQYNASLIGRTISVIYEDIDFDKNMFVGRTQYDAPDIDACVYFTGNNCEVGNTYQVKITGYNGYDLKGEIQ